MELCAYYGNRGAVKYAEVVALPYTLLLHEGSTLPASAPQWSARHRLDLHAIQFGR